MIQPQPQHAASVRLMVGGDVMLGRNVGEMISRNGAGYPLGPIADLLRQGDLALANLECAITSCTDIWAGVPKAFYFGAPPQAAQSLADAGINLVSLANNHALDFGVKGLLDTLHLLQVQRVRYAGAGMNIDAAASPVILDCHGIKFGMVAFCDHQADFAARQNHPGIAYLDLDNERATLDAFRKALAPMRNAAVDWPILSLHWGPNMVLRPSAKFRRLAHAAIEMGWKILFGHSAHVYQGIEIYRGCPILYAAGDLVDDYYVDPDFKNDHQLLFEMELTRTALQRIALHPVFSQNCQARRATGEQFETIVEWMTSFCHEMGTRVQRQGEKIWIEGGNS
ncbi:MAG: CapA family protein [Burkholderiaceae bacterium]